LPKNFGQIDQENSNKVRATGCRSIPLLLAPQIADFAEMQLEVARSVT
jgi:hypothetical protein